ncbi:YjbF family lipoprotein [Salipiger mucosus]|nr:YjbF family lipoprotein [Salipiger mucosus]
MIRRTLRRLAPLGLLAALAACGNSPYQADPFSTLYESLRPGGDGAPGALTQEAIAQTLAGAGDRAVTFLEIDERESQSLLVNIESNPPYRTYATPTRQAVTIRDGMIVATRGLGGDLMSVDEDELLSLVRSRTKGEAVYIQRFLRSDDRTVPLTYRCSVEPDKSIDVSMGLIQTPAREVVAACTSDVGPPFVDYYVVDPSGQIVASRQWLGRITGYVSTHVLRR